jgi:arylsulfatase A-like enzyme
VKRAVLGIALVAMALLVPDCSGGSEGRPKGAVLGGRDLILTVADSLDGSHLGALGYPRPTTPFLDGLAASGAVLERSISQTSWTMSSVATLFTGMEQEAHGVLRIEQSLPVDGPSTLAELFRRRGYRTVGLVQNAVIAEGAGLERGFDSYESIPFTDEGAEALIQRVRAVASACDRQQPLFLYLHLGPPHMPYQPPEPFRSRFARAGGASEVDGSIRDTTDIMVEGSPPSHADVQRLVELYDGHVAYADSLVRQAVGAFEAAARPATPVMLFTSDHGEAFMQHGAVGHNLFCYEPMIRVPWIMAAAGVIPAGLRVEGTGSLLDVLPTLAELFGLPAPAQGLAGVSLAPNLVSGTPIEDRPLLISSRYPSVGKQPQLGLVEGPWKLVIRRRGQSAQLFHTAEDPDELVDLAASQPERVARMAALLEERRESSRASGAAARRELPASLLRELDALGYGGGERDGGQRDSVEHR